jgi:hypothetical protein
MSFAVPGLARPVPPAARRVPARSRLIGLVAAVTLLIPVGLGSIGSVRAAGTLRIVATTGSDTAAGTELAPWRTIGHGLAALVAGVTLVVHGGTYTEHVSVVLSAGTASEPILVQAASGERPIIKGLLWLTRPTWWTFDGLNVTWDPVSNTASQHMVKLSGGSNWTFKNAEVWGAHSFAGILVTSTPVGWRITANCIHDTYATNSTNQDHNIYVNSGLSAGAGSIDHNILFNATGGRNVKLGGPTISETDGTQNVAVSYNTMYNASQNVSISGSSRNNTIDHNILGRSLENHLIYGYSLSGTGNIAGSNVGFESTRMIDGTNISDGGGNLFPHDPIFDAIGCGAFHPADATSQAYGAYAGGTVLPDPLPTAAANPVALPTPIVDTTRPTVRSRTPAAGTRRVARGVTVKAVMSEPTTGVSYRTARLVNVRSGNRVTVRVTYDAATRTVRIDPRNALRARTWYRVYLLSGIRDRAGNRLVATSWRFLTR